MRTTSLKTIYLTIPELQEAITRYIRDKQGKMDPEDLYTHLMNNEWCMDWASEGEELAISIDGEIRDNIVTKDKTNEQDTGQKQWVVNVEHVDECATENLAVRKVGELCIRFPDELIEQLGWKIGDEVEWGETEICESWGEHKGCTLSNLTKNPKQC
jgi:hypothetical protein